MIGAAVPQKAGIAASAAAHQNCAAPAWAARAPPRGNRSCTSWARCGGQLPFMLKSLAIQAIHAPLAAPPSLPLPGHRP